MRAEHRAVGAGRLGGLLALGRLGGGGRELRRRARRTGGRTAPGAHAAVASRRRGSWRRLAGAAWGGRARRPGAPGARGQAHRGETREQRAARRAGSTGWGATSGMDLYASTTTERGVRFGIRTTVPGSSSAWPAGSRRAPWSHSPSGRGEGALAVRLHGRGTRDDRRAGGRHAASGGLGLLRRVAGRAPGTADADHHAGRAPRDRGAAAPIWC